MVQQKFFFFWNAAFFDLYDIILELLKALQNIKESKVLAVHLQ